MRQCRIQGHGVLVQSASIVGRLSLRLLRLVLAVHLHAGGGYDRKGRGDRITHINALSIRQGKPPIAVSSEYDVLRRPGQMEALGA
jgi:hypothetical protein